MSGQDEGVAFGPGHSAEPEPVPVSAVPASVPNAGLLPNITYLSCPVCYGTRKAFDGLCTTCADPDIKAVRWMLPRLSAEQIDFLRAYEHTLAYQPVEQIDAIEFFVEGEDGEFDEEAEFWLIPNTRHWFASGMSRSGPCGQGDFIRYNPAGLLLRECLMAGASAIVPHLYPPRAAQVGTHPKGGDAKQAPCASMSDAVRQDAPTPSPPTKGHKTP